jgi:hypothetical protein
LHIKKEKMSERLIITPKTRVLQLIEAYPELEEVLVSYVPEFKKLRNPVLRNTVARIATLQQAASIANIKVEELINRLRKEAGQEDIEDLVQETGYNTERPDWFSPELIAGGLDAAVMLSAGEHPVSQVIADLNVLPQGRIYELKAPFLPAPLIDKASSLGLAHWITQPEEEKFLIYFFKD